MIITVPVVFILLEQPHGESFLLERALGLHNDRFDGLFSLPGGKVEPYETLREAACREAYEEIGITININDLEFIHLGNHFAVPTKKVIGVIFRARSWKGTPTNCEPAKHTQARWFARNALPKNLCPFVAACLDGASFSENLMAVGVGTNIVQAIDSLNQ